MTDWPEVRASFPAAATCCYLNTAAGGPISTAAAAAAGCSYYEATARDGDVHWDAWLDRVEDVRGSVARLINAHSHEIAFTNNASSALNFAARKLLGTGSVVALRGDFPSVTWPWLQLGYEVDFLDTDDDGGVTVEAIAAALQPHTRILTLGLVHYRTGFRHDLDALGELCREHQIVLVVDATQSLGALAIDVSGGAVDFLACTGYKWLNSGYGIGFFYVNERHAGNHPVVGWRSARDPYALVSDELDLTPDARAMEAGHPPFPNVFTLGAALGLQHELGAAAIESRVLQLSGLLRKVLVDAGLPVSTSARPGAASGIVLARCADAAGLRDALREHDVLVSARGDGIRVSVHLYNDEDDLRHLADTLHELRGSGLLDC